MTQRTRQTVIYALCVLAAVSAFGQDRTGWRTAGEIREGARGSATGTVVDVDDTRNRLEIRLDSDNYGHVTVEADSVSTQYNGFGTVINGKPELFRGSAGFSNVREGDRVEVRGTGKGNAIVVADSVTLVGRDVPASPVGVGQTRPPGSVSTPTAPRTSVQSDTSSANRVVGTIRQVNATDNRLVVETDRREILNIRTTATTPVYYRGASYRISNLEVGDEITVDTYATTTADREVRARSIEVTASVQERGPGASTRVQTTTGRITRLDNVGDRIWINDGRSEIQVDLYRANDARGNRVRANDFRVGERIEVTGSYSGNLLLASTVRDVASEDVFSPTTPDDDDDDDSDREYVTVSFSATVTESLQSSPTLVLRDRSNGRTIQLHVVEDLVVRTKAGSYTTAEKIKEGESIVVKAFRDQDGTYIAQTIRYR